MSRNCSRLDTDPDGLQVEFSFWENAKFLEVTVAEEDEEEVSECLLTVRLESTTVSSTAAVPVNNEILLTREYCLISYPSE